MNVGNHTHRASSKITFISSSSLLFRSICHDWSDAKCCELSNTVAAMELGYSKISINDWVLPNTGSPIVPALLDLQVQAVPSGMERTQTQWAGLLEAINFHTDGKEIKGLIEAARKA